MKATPLISVILPSYNHADYVAAAVHSVLDQTVNDLELIVIDDSSTDGTPDIVENIKDSRIHLLKLTENRSKQPRNLALEMAQGKYVAFQNSDDVWHPQKLERQIDRLNKNPELVACFTGVKIIDDSNRFKRRSWAHGLFTTKNRSNVDWLRHFFLHGNCLCITSAAVRRESLEKVGGFRGSLVQLSDLDLWIRLAAIGGFHIIRKKLTHFRRVGQSNLSAPSTVTTNRTTIEFADVLGHYAKQPILDLLPVIFKKEIKSPAMSPIILKGCLVQLAWSVNTPAHNLFADRLMASILDNDTARDEISNCFGTAMIREFYKKRGELKLDNQG